MEATIIANKKAEFFGRLILRQFGQLTFSCPPLEGFIFTPLESPGF
jgi:hypothetical protein